MRASQAPSLAFLASCLSLFSSAVTMDKLVAQYSRQDSRAYTAVDEDEERFVAGSSTGLPKFELPGSVDVRLLAFFYT
jgi:hypothetical protein